MIYKNGIKEYTMTTLFFGGPMGFLYGLVHQSILLGVVSGVFCGCVFSDEGDLGGWDLVAGFPVEALRGEGGRNLGEQGTCGKPGIFF